MTSYLASIAPALANHLWQSTLFAMAVWLVTLLLRGNRAQVRYRLWLAASIKFLVPFSLLTGLGTLLPKAPQAAFQAQPGLYSTVDIVSQPFLNLTPPMTAPVAHVASFTEWLPLALAAIWLCGAVVMLLVWLARWRQISRTLQQAVLAEDGREWEILRQVDVRLPLMRSQASMEPGIFGVFRPVLLWPERLSARLDDEHIEAILLHELMHVWRRDNLTAALHMMVEAIFWFHPMVWWIERRMVEERERTCDEAVIQMGGSAEAYAESLVKACRFCVESPLACVSGITGADLGQRITAIMQHKLGGRLGLGKALLLAAMCVGVVAGPLVFGQVDTALHAAILVSPKLLSAPPPPPPPPPPPRGWHEPAKPSIAFDVVSVRQDKSDREAGANFVLGPGNAYATTGGRFTAFNLPVLDYIRFAYKLTNGQTEMLQSQAPKWVSVDKFDIEATSTNHDPTKDQMRQMVQSLLADRFNLKIHTEIKDLPVFAMVLSKPGKLGPQLRQHPANDSSCSNLTPPQTDSPTSPTTVAGGFPITCGGIVSAGAASVPSHIRVGARNIPIALLASNLGGFDRPLLDKTGLTGTYDFILEWGSNPTSDDGASLQEALQEQLGLTLKATKGPMDVLVLDHIEMPSDN